MSKKQWHRRRRPRGRKPEETDAAAPPCPICSKPLRDISSAIVHKESSQPAHFECVLQSLRESMELEPNEKICYLGKGSFGVIQLRNANSPLRFFIRKRIQYEDLDAKPDWRADIVKDQLG
jgi:hypothetical protein